MDNETKHLVVLNPDRSYVKSLFLGIRTAMDNIGNLLHYMWPSVLLTLLFPIPCISLFWGQADAILRRWIMLGYVPETTAGALKSDIRKMTVRNIFNFLILLACVLLLITTNVLLSVQGVNIWIAVSVMLFVVMLLLPLDVCCMWSSFSDRSCRDCMGGYLRGWRCYGRLFAFQLLGFMLLLLAAVVICLPLICVVVVGVEAYQARMLGDVAFLPPVFVLLVFLAYVFSSLLMMFVSLIFRFSRCLMWGSIEEVPADTQMESTGVDGVVGR